MKVHRPALKPFIPKLRIWKLKDPLVKANFEQACSEKLNSFEFESVEDTWKKLKNALLETANNCCGKTKKPLRKRETWWWTDEVKVVINEKRRLWKIWKQGGSKEEYLNAKRVAKRSVYLAKKNAEIRRFSNLQPGLVDIFKIAKQIRKDNVDVIGDKCVKDDSGKLATNDDAKLTAWKQHYERLLNIEFPWDSDVLVDEPIAGVPVYVTEDLVIKAINKMKPGKAAGPSGIVAEMLKCSGQSGAKMIADLANKIINTGTIPSDWEHSFIINLYKGKGDALDRGNYRGLKLLDHVMKVLERVVESFIRERVNIDDMQFGFMPGRGTSDAIFILRQLQEKCLAKNKNLYLAFVDLEKAFDRVPRRVIWWAMRKLGLEEWIVSLVQSMYKNTKSKVRVNSLFTDEFDVKVGVHQGSVLSPLLFIIVLEALSREFRTGTPWELLYADDLVIIAETEEELRARLLVWKRSLEEKGLRVNIGKTKIMVSGNNMGCLKDSGKFPCGVCRKGVGCNSIYCSGCSHWVHKKCSGISGSLSSNANFRCSRCLGTAQPIDGRPCLKFKLSEEDVLDVVDNFCYLGDMIDASGGCDASITSRIRAAWGKFRQLLPLLTSRGLSLKTRGKIYNTYIRPVLLYASESWAPTAINILKLQRNDRSMTRWICNVKLVDRISSKSILQKLGLQDVKDILRYNRLRWYGHVERNTESTNAVTTLFVDGRRSRGRPKKTWTDDIKKDRKEWAMERTNPHDRADWRFQLKRNLEKCNPLEGD